MTDDNPDTTDEPPKNETAKQLGSASLYPLVRLWGALYWFVMGIVSRLPFREKVYRAMVVKGYENLYSNTSGHVVVNTIYGDGACIPRPATLDTAEEKVKTNNDEYWTATSGVETVRIGKAPVATGVADDHELVDPIAARIAEAVDLSPRRAQTVVDDGSGFRPTRYIDPTAAEIPTSTAGDAAAGVSADGGVDVAALVDQRAQQLLDQLVPRMNTFDDIWIDVENPRDDTDGWIVSMEKAYEMHWDQAASEEMQKQEDRGRLAEMDPDQHRKRAIIIALVGLGGVALGLFGPALASNIAGGGGGGGGGGPAIGLEFGLMALQEALAAFGGVGL